MNHSHTHKHILRVSSTVSGFDAYSTSKQISVEAATLDDSIVFICIIITWNDFGLNYVCVHGQPWNMTGTSVSNTSTVEKDVDDDDDDDCNDCLSIVPLLSGGMLYIP
jgi:hypothetical protein